MQQSRDRSCGCFGSTDFAPWKMAFIDVSVIAALVFFVRTSTQLQSESKRLSILSVLILPILAVIVLPVLVVWAAPPFFSSNDVHDWDELDVVELIPDDWIGSQFPLLGFIDEPERLLQNEHLVFLYHDGCMDCRAELPKLNRLAFKSSANDSHNIVAIDVHQSAGMTSISRNLAHGIWRDALNKRKEWFARTPSILHLKKGIVVRVYDRVPSAGELGWVNE